MSPLRDTVGGNTAGRSHDRFSRRPALEQQVYEVLEPYGPLSGSTIRKRVADYFFDSIPSHALRVRDGKLYTVA